MRRINNGSEIILKNCGSASCRRVCVRRVSKYRRVRAVGIQRDLTAVTASATGEHHNRRCCGDGGRGDCLRYYSAGVQWKNDWVLSPSVDRLPWLLCRFVGFERPLVTYVSSGHRQILSIRYCYNITSRYNGTKAAVTTTTIIFVIKSGKDDKNYLFYST